MAVWVALRVRDGRVKSEWSGCVSSEERVNRRSLSTESGAIVPFISILETFNTILASTDIIPKIPTSTSNMQGKKKSKYSPRLYRICNCFAWTAKSRSPINNSSATHDWLLWVGAPLCVVNLVAPLQVGNRFAFTKWTMMCLSAAIIKLEILIIRSRVNHFAFKLSMKWMLTIDDDEFQEKDIWQGHWPRENAYPQIKQKIVWTQILVKSGIDSFLFVKDFFWTWVLDFNRYLIMKEWRCRRIVKKP